MDALSSRGKLMAEASVGSSQEVMLRNGHDPLESRLRSLFAEQQRLREELERTRAQLDQVNAEVLRFQEEYCTDAEREEEYGRCLQKVLGFDTRLDPELIACAGTTTSGQTLLEIIEELEREAAQSSSPEVR
jgi:predicted nuclease with TOPRIM domain